GRNMRRRTFQTTASLLALCLAISGPPWAFSGTALSGSEGRDSASVVQTPVAQRNFTAAELDELLAPIALYPDPLLAQILPAATYIDQLVEASQLLGGSVNDSLINSQSWDASVKAIAHYPPVLQMMTQKSDWTIALGQAVVTQPTDVKNAIQRLRAEA